MFTNKGLGKKNNNIQKGLGGMEHGNISHIGLNAKKKVPDINNTDSDKLSLTSKVLMLIIVFSISVLGFVKYIDYQEEKQQTLAIVSEPQVNDIYFIDFRLLGDDVRKKLRPTEKYRIAKVVDITGDIVTLLYGVFYYQRQHAVRNSIQYGQLRYSKYFETKRYDIPHSDILAMHQNEALYVAKRPVGNKLYGNFVNPIKDKVTSELFILGKKENNIGEAFLRDKYNELGHEKAFELFRKSSELGYPQGQVNLASMYIDGHFIDTDLNTALHWLKVASLQSYKPAILKYGIICKQVELCNEYDFYKELSNSGVNIKVRQLEIKPKSIINTM